MTRRTHGTSVMSSDDVSDGWTGYGTRRFGICKVAWTSLAGRGLRNTVFPIGTNRRKAVS